MGAPPPNSQVAPLPQTLPFRVISKTIAAGAYASVRKAVPLDRPSPVIAVKFIHKEHATKVGRLSSKQIQFEIAIHSNVCHGKNLHPNIIQLIAHGQDAQWYWIAMDFAGAGDLFDKVEADEGVSEDIAHLYFRQLMSAINWCHSKGYAHRDIKPENMLLSDSGDLKLADFGLATSFLDTRTGKVNLSSTVCGSPPYIAPEIIAIGEHNTRRKQSKLPVDKAGYRPDTADLWSCAVVLFVLLVGNTPWDVPRADASEEYAEFLETNGRPNDELWDNIPNDALSLIRGMLRVQPAERFTYKEIAAHPWFLRPNKHLTSTGKSADGVALATEMLERLHIDMANPYAVTTRSKTLTQAEYESQAWAQAFPNTQPETPAVDTPFDWESRPAPAAASNFVSQPTTTADRVSAAALNNAAALLADDIFASQFTNTGIPASCTQGARKFNDIAPASCMSRFFSVVPIEDLLSVLKGGLAQLSVTAVERVSDTPRQKVLLIKAMDTRRQPMAGNVVIERIGDGLAEVRFLKIKADPVEWRRLFKRVVVQCRGLVLLPRENGWRA